MAPGLIRRYRVTPWLLCLGAYAALSVVLWWHVWTGGPTTHITCLCGDPGQTVWFLKWAEYSTIHGANPFLSNVIQAPQGVNVLDNNSELLVGLILAPLTWAEGPVLAFNLAVTLVPVVTALAGVAVCRRFTAWIPAWIGGLLFGFSPFVVGNLPFGHLSVTLLALPALQFLCLHEIVVRQSGSPERWGVLLGILTVAEFFVSTEILAASALLTAVGMGALLVGAAVADRQALRRRWRHAVSALSIASAVSLIGLAGPAWYAVAGPQHFSGLVWPTISVTGSAWNSFFWIPAGSDKPSLFAELGGYDGAVGPPLSYFGPWLLGSLVASVVLLRRMRLVWFSALTVVVSAVLSLGASLLPDGWYSTWWLPWRMVQHLPVVENVAPQNVIGLAYLFGGLIVALGIDRTWGVHRASAGAEVASTASTHRWSRPRPVPHRVAAGRPIWAVSAVAIAAAAVIPVAVSYSSAPYVTPGIALPGWVTGIAPRLVSDPTLLVLPYSPSRVGDSMAWQAIDGMSYRMIGAYAKVPGIGGAAQYGGAAGSASATLSLLSFDTGPEPRANGPTLSVVADELRQAHVSEVVITQGSMRNPPFAAGFMTAVLGEAPVVEDGIWVWPDATAAPGPLDVAANAVWKCFGQLKKTVHAPLQFSPDCVLVAARARST